MKREDWFFIVMCALGILLGLCVGCSSRRCYMATPEQIEHEYAQERVLLRDNYKQCRRQLADNGPEVPSWLWGFAGVVVGAGIGIAVGK